MQTIKIVVCGDFRAAHPEKIVFSKEISELFNSADLCICNFEAPVKVTNAKPIKKVVIQGLDGYIVSEKGNQLHICKRSEEQRIKEFNV